MTEAEETALKERVAHGCLDARSKTIRVQEALGHLFAAAFFDREPDRVRQRASEDIGHINDRLGTLLKDFETEMQELDALRQTEV